MESLILISDSGAPDYTHAVQLGLRYRFRYRAQNAVGWSAFSPVNTVLAAERPIAPLAPVAMSSSDSSITVNLGACHDNKGAQLTSYSLYIDEGSLGSDFQIAY